MTDDERPEPEPVDPWEVAEDRCEVCGTLIGYGMRALHLGRCDDHPRRPQAPLQ